MLVLAFSLLPIGVALGMWGYARAIGGRVRSGLAMIVAGVLVSGTSALIVVLLTK